MRIIPHVVLLSLSLVLTGCVQNMQRSMSQPSMTYTQESLSELPAVSSLAIQLNHMIKNGMLPVSPYINIDDAGVSFEQNEEQGPWTETNVMVIEAGLSQEGWFQQRMLVESVDKLGRLDLRDDRITYGFRDPNADESSDIARDITTLITSARKTGHPKIDKADFKQRVEALQQRCGLEVDGNLGKQTAACIGNTFPLLDVKSMSSTMIFPKNPRVRVYVVPRAVVEQNPGDFYQGFESLGAVQSKALDQNSFREKAVKGACFVVFAYFFDRPMPGEPISLRVSPFQRKLFGKAGEDWYPEPGRWPVVVENFTIDQATDKELYLNIFSGSGWSKTCIASQRLQ